MSSRFVSAVVLVAGFAFVTGCERNARLEESRSYDLPPGEAQSMSLSKQPKPQKLTVDFKSSEGDVVVLVFKEADAKGDDMLTASDKKALAMKKGKTESFAVDIPENTETVVVVRDSLKKTKVELKVTNRK